MATFYGHLVGNRGPTTRTGSAKSGIEASLQSYDGSVQTMLTYDVKTGALMVEISTAQGSKRWGDLIFRGTFKEFEDMCRNYRPTQPETTRVLEGGFKCTLRK